VEAEAAARAVLAGQVTAVPKTGSHLVEMVRCLRVARATAVKARSQAVNALRALVVTAAPELREQLRAHLLPSWPARPRSSSLARS
jgi:transposase